MNKVTIIITSCEDCPNAKTKYIPEAKKQCMYCQTIESCLRLREGWGKRPIPDWCPRLKDQRVIQEEKND